MLYAQLHTYTNSEGVVKTTVAARFDQPDDTWVPFDTTVDRLKVSGGTVAIMTDAEYAASQNAVLWPAYQAQAQAALDKTDLVAMRCLKAGVSFPAEWASYVTSLRGIIRASTGDASLPLPTQPAYPAGT